MKYKYLLNVVKTVIDIQKEKKGIELLVGRGKNQRIMKILPIITNMVLDNLECIILQGLNFSYLCPRSCRFCEMLSDHFYRFLYCQACLKNRRINELSKFQIIDTIITSQELNSPLRKESTEIDLRIKTEEIWWRHCLHDKTEQVRGSKLFHFTPDEIKLRKQANDLNIKFLYNPLPTEMFGFFTRWNTRPSIFPQQCSNLFLFPLDKLHSFGKGNMELTFRFTSAIIFLFGKLDPRNYRHNLGTLDERIINFDIRQPSGTSPWGKKIERRLPGIASK